MPPRRLLERYRGATRIVEVGAGQRFDDALAFARALPGTRVVVTDVDVRVLQAQAPLWADVDDVTRPRLEVYGGAALVYGVRLPEEMHSPAGAVARRVGADFALRLLGDDAPALPGWGPGEVLPDPGGAWRLWPAPGRRDRAP